jgi:hypothetical protein
MAVPVMAMGAAAALAIPFPLVSLNPTPVQYKGDDLDPERGPGLGCFRFQLIVLGIFIVLTPLTVLWQWPDAISAALLFAVVILLLVTGQTIIFLLRLVAADRRGRRRPLGSATRTVGELEDAAVDATDDAADDAARAEPTPPATPPSGESGPTDLPPSDEGAVRQ